MKMKLTLGLLIVSCGMQLIAMEGIKVTQLKFIVAKKGEDLSGYKALALKYYALLATDPNEKHRLEQAVSKQFDVLVSWIGQNGRVFIKALAEETPVGFTTLESLGDDDTRVAFHLSPIAPEYKSHLVQYIDCARDEFPEVRSVFTSCSGAAALLQEKIKQMGFVEDDSYVANKELVPNPAGYIGYRKDLK